MDQKMTKTKTIVQPGRVVDFVTPSGEGVRVVRIILSTKTPRVLAWSQFGSERLPLSLFLDELLSCVEEAKSRLSHLE